MERTEESRLFIFEPREIEAVLTRHELIPSRFVIIPWFADKITLDFKDKPRLRAQSAKFNDDVAKIDACDPYIKRHFGIEWPGEGLVYFPLGKTDPQEFGRLAFKVKGETHSKGSGGEKKARVQTPVAENVLAFVDMMVTAARVLQGAEELFGEGPYEKKGLSPLIKWVMADVKSEGQDELEASGVSWGDAMKVIAQKTREHYFAEIEKL